MKDKVLAAHRVARMEDPPLLARVRGGDLDAFSELYRSHQPSAQRAAAGWVGHQEAADLVAEAFTRILAALLRGHGPVDHLGPYLVRTMRSVRCDRIRRPTPTPVGPDHRIWRENTDDSAPFDGPVADRDLLRRLLSELPTRYRLTVWLHVIEGQPSAQIGRQLGLTTTSAAALVYRVRRQLAELGRPARDLPLASSA